MPATSLSALDERLARVRFRRAVTLMLMTLVVPGSAQLVAGNKRVGRVALRIWLTLVAALLGSVLLGLVWHGFAFWLISNAFLLGFVRVLLLGLAVGWAVLFVDAWRLGQPLELRQKQRLAMVGINGFLTFSVAGSLLFASHVVAVGGSSLTAVFGSGPSADESAGRYNVLLIGGDAGAGRWGMRADSINIASIDAETGRTVLIGLPRNMQNFPFAEGSVMAEQFPDGYDCDDCYLNSLATFAADNKALFRDSENPGVDATIQAVEGITGLDISYWAMVNMRGFQDLVDAFDGVTLNVRDRIPVGGLGNDVTGYIEPGVRKLNGFETLWFSRAREGSDDYSRMARQKCVMQAMVDQVSPQKALRNFQKIAEASAAMVSTSIPTSEVDRFLDLALKARSQKISTLSVVPPLVNTADPDIDLVHRKVAEAIARAEGTAEAAPPKRRKPKPTPAEMTGGSVGSLSNGYAANASDDLASAC